MQNDWFSTCLTGTTYTITFLYEENRRYWPPDIHLRTPLPPPPPAATRVALEGPGSVWMYAHAAFHFWASSIRHIEIFSPQEARMFILTPEAFNTGGDDGSENLSWERMEEGAYLVRLENRGGNQDYACVSRLAGCLYKALQGKRIDSLVLSGAGRVIHYAAFAAAVAELGIRTMHCLVPPEGFALIPVHSGSGASLRLADDTLMRRIFKGSGSPPAKRVLGIIANPNHGKSVLSHLLQRIAIATRDRLVWRFDSDPASPTADWYMRTLFDDREGADFHRNQQKITWSQEAQHSIATRLKNTKEYFDIVIADMPGGDHAQNPPKPIPDGRETLFSLVDEFILLYSTPNHPPEVWQNALRKAGIRGEITCMLESRHPEGKLRVDWVEKGGEVWKGYVEGLDRKQIGLLCKADPKQRDEILGGIKGIGEFLDSFLAKSG